jgi:hypothetical protein
MNFTKEEKTYLIEFISIRANPQKKLDRLLKKIKDGEDEDPNLREWQISVERKYHEWAIKDLQIEAKINDELYITHPIWPEAQTLLKEIAKK